jgi:glycosyltransferase involved in cell wall biosynthesis
MSIVAVIPAHNEQETVRSVVERARACVDRVVVVDDGSTDATAERAIAAGADLVALRPNRGKGAALRAGIDRALALGADTVVTLDADGEHDPDEIPLLIRAIARADVVLGARRVYRSGLRRALNDLALFWFRLIDPEIRDTICGFRAFRRGALSSLASDSPGFAYEHDVILKALVSGLVIETVDITTVPRAASHVDAREILRVNNRFTSWVLQHRRELRIPLGRKAILCAGCAAGLALGTPMEAVLMRSRSRLR